MPRWIPNFLTVVRLILVPIVIRAILAGRVGEALALFVAAAVTDVLDGAIARAFQITSPFGAYLDPVADKALLSGVFVALAVTGNIPLWLVVIIFGRDLYLLFGAGLLYWLGRQKKFPPSWWGKASTFVQIVTSVAWMVRSMHHATVLNAISYALLWPCAAFTIWSGVHYTWRGVQAAQAH